jgi:hypothetical protein
MFPEMSIAPLCIAPFSITDMVYNPSCYTDQVLEGVKGALRMYVWFNLLFFQILAAVIKKFWVPVACGTAFAFTSYCLVKWVLSEGAEEPLSELETEIIRCIHLNATTGCTTQMLYEYMNDGFADKPVSLAEVKATLLQLKTKGYVLSTQATLWLVSGN